MRKIDHPNLVRLYETCTSLSNYYIFMEYCSEGDLKQFIEKFNRQRQPQYESKGQNQLEENDAKYVIREIVKGLSYLSMNLIMHRDIKLENILVNKKTTAYHKRSNLKI